MMRTRANHLWKILTDSAACIRAEPLTQLGLLFLTLPFWWLLGLEQIIWPAALVWIAYQTLRLNKGVLRLPAVLRWFLAFLAVVLISGLFIVERFRWLTFVRNLSAYISGFLLLFIIVNRVCTWRWAERLLSCLVAMLTFASLIGLLGIFKIWRPNTLTLLGRILPDWILGTKYGAQVGVLSIGKMAYFGHVGRYFRVNSLFLYATHYASALSLGLPAVFFLYRQSGTRRVKWLLLAAGLIMLVNLLCTTGRMAAAGLLIGGLYYLVLRPRNWSKVVRRGALIVAVICLALGVYTLSPQGLGVRKAVRKVAETILYARGVKGLGERFTIYRDTFTGVLQRPLLGWGTERDVPGLSYPAGSHSYYLAILYRHGGVGLLCFLALLWFLWRDTRPPFRGQAVREDATRWAEFLTLGRWILVAAFVDGLSTVPLTDTTTIVVQWLLFSLLVASRLAYDESQIQTVSCS